MTTSAEERAALADQVRRLLEARCTEADVRRAMESDTGHDPALWRDLATLGLPGLLVPEAQGGAGLGPVELGLVMEEAGRALLPAPLLSAAMAATLLARLGATDLLPALADGSRVYALALTGPAADWTERGVGVRATGDRLTGTARFVPDAAIADTLLVATENGIYAVDPDAPGLTVTPLPTFDRTRRLADLSFADTPARPLGGGWADVAATLDLGLVALAGEQAGGTRRLLEMATDYARERYQFGRAIGSFQAVKHMAADLLLESESATSAARHAAQALATNAPDKGEAVALAAFACADAFVTTAATAIQMHGGIAFTWSHPAHLYLRRARADAQLFGSPAAWRDRFVTALEARA